MYNYSALWKIPVPTTIGTLISNGDGTYQFSVTNERRGHHISQQQQVDKSIEYSTTHIVALLVQETPRSVYITLIKYLHRGEDKENTNRKVEWGYM